MMENDGRAPAKEKTLLEWACARYPESPRKRIKQWIADGRFRIGGATVTHPGQSLPNPGEALRLGGTDASVASWTHRKTIHPKLTVLHLDASLAVVDKGAGLLSVPAEGSRQSSAIELLEAYLNDPKADGLRRRVFRKSGLVKVMPVHRLDQYTSGLMCFAVDPVARAALIDQVRSHELLREYWAFADGESSEPSGVWRDFLKLTETGHDQRIGSETDPDSTEAITRYEVIEVFARHHVSKLRLRLESGLKHQIRIQAAQRGMALLGDRLYHAGTRKALERKGGKAPFGCQRQALHAAVLGLLHPSDGRSLRFESRLPSDLKRLEARLRSANG